MRKRIVAGNWKMNLDWTEAKALAESIKELEIGQTEVIIFPSSLYLASIAVDDTSNIKVGAQNAYPKPAGAFTGEQSFAQLKSIGVTHVLIGHSERREYFNETNSFLKEKIDACLEAGLTPIFCCGEALAIRENNSEKEFVTNQIAESLFHLTADDFAKCVLAYEPIWAIGTGLTASAVQAEEMHHTIRDFVAQRYGATIANNISILYGGSCNENNAKELFACENVDGGLIGGASLKATSFSQIIQAF